MTKKNRDISAPTGFSYPCSSDGTVCGGVGTDETCRCDEKQKCEGRVWRRGK
jgi:hypothetical protein